MLQLQQVVMLQLQQVVMLQLQQVVVLQQVVMFQLQGGRAEKSSVHTNLFRVYVCG
jgi:hypothetical protein